eukprot:14172551-Ditylum_brightwellii.AAC.1
MAIMTGCGKEAMGTESVVATKVTEVNLCNGASDLAQVQAEIVELNACYATSSARHTGVTL